MQRRLSNASPDLDRIGVRPSRPFWLLFALIVVATMLGGGGSPAPLQELIVELTALAIAVAASWSGRLLGWSSDRTGWTLLALVVLIPLIQLMPLPPFLWTALPGRGAAADTLTLLGHGADWRPVSLFPTMTLASALAMLPPLLAARLTQRLAPADRRRLILLVAGVALVSAVLGLVQFAAGGVRLHPYGETHPGAATGFFANRNALADLLLIGLIAMAAWVAGGQDQKRRRALIVAQGALLVVLAVLATGSRTGALLLVATVLGFAALVLRVRVRSRWLGVVILIAVAALATAPVFVQIGALGTITDRFSTVSDDRSTVWADAVFAARRAWPVGSGAGTFVPVNAIDEALDHVGVTIPNRAHNDYIEVALEAGLVGVVLVAAMLAFVAVRLRAALRRSAGSGRLPAIAAAAGLAVLAAHSGVDYPLRNLTLATIAGALIGLLLLPDVTGPIADRRERWSAIVVAGAAVVLALFSAGDRLARQGVLPLALAQRLPSASGHLLTAQALVAAGLSPLRDGEAAVRAEPMNQAAIRTLGIAALQSRQIARGDALMQAAGRLGWRDPETELYWGGVAAQTGEFTIAAQRYEAALRTSGGQEPAINALVRPIENTAEGRNAFAARMAVPNGWANGYVGHAEDLDAEALERRAAMVARAVALGATFSSDVLGDFERRLFDEGVPAAALRLWQHSAKGSDTHGDNWPKDGSFEHGDLSSNRPFEWRSAPLPGLTAAIEPAPFEGASKALHIRADGPAAAPAATQSLVLATGPWMLRLTVRGRGPADSLIVRVQCARSNVVVGPRDGQRRGDQYSGTFTVPPGCEGQRIEIAASTNPGEPAEYWIDDVVIGKASTAVSGGGTGR